MSRYGIDVDQQLINDMRKLIEIGMNSLSDWDAPDGVSSTNWHSRIMDAHDKLEIYISKAERRLKDKETRY